MSDKKDGLAARLRGMTWRERVEYLWTYYRYHALAALGAIIIAVLAAYGLSEARKDVLISGIFINIDTSDEGYAHLSDGYWQACGGRRGTRADIIETMKIRYSQEDPDQDSVTLMTSIDTMISARSLDYMVLDETALSYYGPLENCADLESALPPELYARLSDRAVSSYGIERGGEYAAALELTGSPFESRYGLKGGRAYLVITANAKDPEKVEQFIKYFFELT